MCTPNWCVCDGLGTAEDLAACLLSRIYQQNVRTQELRAMCSVAGLPGYRCAVSAWAAGWKLHLVHSFSLYDAVVTLKISFMRFLQQQYMVLVKH